MSISPEIKAAQEAYAARPWFVLWQDSHCSVPNRFDTFDEAFDYIQYQWVRIQRTVKTERYNSSKLGFRPGGWGSYIEGPGMKMPLSWLMLTSDVSSY